MSGAFVASNLALVETHQVVDADSKNRYRNAQRRADFTIDQSWDSYSGAEHDRWDRLFRRSGAILKDRACPEFIAALDTLKLSESGIPDMERLSTVWRS